MKKPLTEITNEKAKFFLGAYRPNGADAQDAVFHDALEQATLDPELAAWFKEQRDFDAVIIDKLAEVQPPTGLKAAILAGLETQQTVRSYQFRPLLALAAILVVSGMIIYPMYLQEENSRPTFPRFQQASLSIVTSSLGPGLDLKTPDIRLIQDYIEQNRGPCAPVLPAAFNKLSTAGCKVFRWNDQPVSLTCFRLPSGELIHLFVTDEKTFRNQETPVGIVQTDGWYMKVERVQGMLMMFVSRATMKEIEQYI